MIIPHPPLILHSFRRCPFAIRVRMTLEEKKITYTTIEEKLSNFSETLLQLHPEGKVPLLIHGKTVIYESSIITEYLEDQFPNPPLMPQTAQEKAQVRLWTYWCNYLFKPDLDLYKYEWKKLLEEQKKEVIHRLHGLLHSLEKQLSLFPYLVGEKFTLADIHVFPFYRQLFKAQTEHLNLKNYVSIDRWYKEIQNRPSFLATGVEPIRKD